MNTALYQTSVLIVGILCSISMNWPVEEQQGIFQKASFAILTKFLARLRLPLLLARNLEFLVIRCSMRNAEENQSFHKYR